METLIADYGGEAISLIVLALTFLLGKFFADKKGSAWYGVAERALFEVEASVREVHQTYAAEAKRGRADGKWTDEEKAEAKSRAIDIAKSNLGPKGLKKLAKIADVDTWLGNKVEATVHKLKAEAADKSPSTPPQA